MYRASIAIFRNAPDFHYEAVSRPIVPDLIFEAAKRVIQSKGCEFIKTGGGVYIVRYAEHGPYQSHISEEWLPVYVARVEEWSSGGIKQSEMDAYSVQKPLELDPQQISAFASESPETQDDRTINQQTTQKQVEETPTD